MIGSTRLARRPRSIYTRCTYCNFLTFREGECDDCGYAGQCAICKDSLADEWRRSAHPQLCADPHCVQEWNEWEAAE